jgi:hypothetical protein
MQIEKEIFNFNFIIVYNDLNISIIYSFIIFLIRFTNFWSSNHLCIFIWFMYRFKHFSFNYTWVAWNLWGLFLFLILSIIYLFIFLARFTKWLQRWKACNSFSHGNLIVSCRSTRTEIIIFSEWFVTFWFGSWNEWRILEVWL